MRSRLCVLALLAVTAVVAAAAQQPAAGSWHDEVRRLAEASVRRPATRGARALEMMTSTIAESEPNDSAAVADRIAVGEQATGVVNPEGDVDTWFVDLMAGQFVSMDVDAKSLGSLLDPVLVLFAPDGRTILAANDDFDGFDSRISFRVPASGRYFVAIRSFGDLGDPRFTYAINFATITCRVVGTEREPNDSPGSATPLAVDGDGSGEVCAGDGRPQGDVDYWAFTARAGTAIELDVDVAETGVRGDPFLELFAGDGTTRLAFNDNQDVLDSRLEHSIATTGTYYAAVSTVADPGGNPFPYALHMRGIPQGPGDPIAVRADGLGLPLGLAVGSSGDLFVADFAGNRVVRISANGGFTIFATGITGPLGLAFDTSGHLLVTSLDGDVHRVTPDGRAAPVITDAGQPFWIAVAPDGRIWLTDVSDRSLRRYGTTGQFEASFDGTVLGGMGPGPLTIGPLGEPYVSSGTEIWKLEGGRFQRVLADTVTLWAPAFDAKGNIYVPAPTAGRIKLFDPAGRPVADPFAVGPDAPQALAFGRDAAGTPVRRIFATEPRVGRLIEVNPSGVEHPGQPLEPVVLVDVAAAALLGGGGLSAAEMESLDARGNRNGRYDVGDLQAHLRATSALPGAAPFAAPSPGSDQ